MKDHLFTPVKQYNMEFFCAAITENGFFDGFSEVFNEKRLRRLYVIKGASGVGKSTLMRKIANEGERRGYAVDRIYCSSDPKSLDGAVVEDIGIIDGTPPHTYEPKMAGAFESLVDLGRFWNRDKLTPYRDELFRLAERKRVAFSRIYELMAIYGRTAAMLNDELSAQYDRAKVRDYIHSLVNRKLSKGERGEAQMRIFSASLGDTILPAHEKQYTLNAESGFAPFFLGELLAALQEKGVKCYYSPELPSIDRIETIYLPSLGLIYTSHAGGRVIGGERFKLPDASTEWREPAKRMREILAITKRSVERERALAMSIHNDIERIYSTAMDFEKLNSYTAELIGEIFGE